jgi:hypothetical protein
MCKQIKQISYKLIALILSMTEPRPRWRGMLLWDFERCVRVRERERERERERRVERRERATLFLLDLLRDLLDRDFLLRERRDFGI